MSTHYERLGVARGASFGEIRSAYRRLARRHHPDRKGGDPVTMAAINDAYAVLGDPRRRAEYDSSLRAGTVTPGSTGGGATAAPVPPEPRPFDLLRRDDSPARYPWRPALVVAAVGAIGVIALSALMDPPKDPEPDNLLRVGDCVVIEPNRDAREVRCTETGALIVRSLVGFDEECPIGTTGHRDRQGMGTACVEDAATG